MIKIIHDKAVIIHIDSSSSFGGTPYLKRLCEVIEQNIPTITECEVVKTILNYQKYDNPHMETCGGFCGILSLLVLIYYLQHLGKELDFSAGRFKELLAQTLRSEIPNKRVVLFDSLLYPIMRDDPDTARMIAISLEKKPEDIFVFLNSIFSDGLSKTQLMFLPDVLFMTLLVHMSERAECPLNILNIKKIGIAGIHYFDTVF
jgi:hypothetical protein